MGLFHFPLNELAGWALNNMGMVVLCLMLPTFIAALAFLPFLCPVPQTITIFFSRHHWHFLFFTHSGGSVSSCLIFGGED